MWISIEHHFQCTFLQADSVRREELWAWLMKDAGQLPVAAAKKDNASQVVLDLLPSPHRSSSKSEPVCERLLSGLCQAQADEVQRHRPLDMT